MLHRRLIYDDDADILEVCATILRMKGYDVLCKDDCKTVLNDIEAYSPDVILMDNWLPDIGGVKSIQLIKKTPQFKDIPVIFFSANSHVEELAKEAGADYMLKKPFDLIDLQKKIEQAVMHKVL